TTLATNRCGVATVGCSERSTHRSAVPDTRRARWTSQSPQVASAGSTSSTSTIVIATGAADVIASAAMSSGTRTRRLPGGRAYPTSGGGRLVGCARASDAGTGGTGAGGSSAGGTGDGGSGRTA